EVMISPLFRWPKSLYHYIDLKQLDEELITSRLKIDSAKIELENTITNALKEKHRIINTASQEAEKALTDARQSAFLIVNKAEAIAKELIDKINHECESNKLIAVEEKEYLIEIARNEAEQISLASQAKIHELEIEIGKLEEAKQKVSKEVLKLEKRQLVLKTSSENRAVAQTITPYQYLIEGPVSEKIKTKLEKVKEKQKSLILEGKGFKVNTFIQWNGSLASGKAMQKRHGKFLVTAFNAEVDNIISNTTARNFSSSTKKIEQWFDRVNKDGKDSFIELSRDFLALRLEEHRYFFEYKYKKEMEIEEQRYMRETLREEATVKKEIEKFIIDREKEEETYQKSLNSALIRLKTANQEEVNKLNTHIEELKIKLERASKEKERALSMAQLTRSGYVYVISNKGSFGENVYKIGMTRRLEPLDRVRELSGASVPFHFNVHALIPSDDAPSLENRLHTKFSSKRVNKVNQRREFFKLTIKEIEDALTEFVDADFNIVSEVTSDQYEESMLLEEELIE
ncbi:MAG: DUF4041 domain-containing protein, partial [Oleibacter sp.]|nr:DUF4041 domain-containing protein [Thalassolituus sp.]